MSPSVIEEPRFWNQLRVHLAFLPVLMVLLVFGAESLLAQDRLATMPGYGEFQKITRERTNAVKLGALTVTWKEEGKAFEYRSEGKRYRYDIESHRSSEIQKKPETSRETNAATRA